MASALEAELARLGRLVAFGVRARRVAPTSSSTGTSREGASRADVASIEIDLTAGIAPRLGAALIAVGLAVMGLLPGVASALSMSILDRYVLGGAIVITALVLWLPAELARRRRVVMGPDELVVFPPCLLPMLPPIRLSTRSVRELVLEDAGSRVQLVALTDDGRRTLLEGMLPASRVIDLPRFYAAYRATLDG
jgi:hypothetical protein